MKRKFSNLTIVEKVKWIIVYALMLLLVLFMSLPLIYMIATAFKPLKELYNFPPTFLTRHPTGQNFRQLFDTASSGTIPMTRYLFNSIVTTAITVFLIVVISSMGAYALEKLKPPGHRFIFKAVIIGLMFVPPAAQIPIYIVMSKLHLLNTYVALILPSLAGPMYLFLMKQFMSQVPDEIIESARIDGASEWKIFWKIIMPATKPAWCTVIVFSFCTQWNNSGNSIIYVTDQSMKTLPYVLSSIGSSSAAMIGAQAAAALLTTSVTIIIYTIMQKNVLDTMSYAGIDE